jgi:hypothetical protein
MTDAKIWADIERITITTGRQSDDVYSDLMIEFQELVAGKTKKVV